ncbi:MAG: translocation/assembly module TamB domain-containing protein [Pseudomonadota bacterium]
MATLLVVLAVGLGGFLWLNSESGQQSVVRLIEHEVTTPGEIELTIGALDGSLLDSFSLQGIQVADGKGAWLTIQQVDATWTPWDLLKGQLVIDALTVSNLSLERLPEGDEAQNDARADMGFPQLPVEVRLKDLTVTRAQLAAAVLGEAMTFDLKAGASATADNGLDGNLTLERTDGTGGLVEANASYHPGRGTLDLSLHAAEPAGGLLARLADLPGLPALSLSLTGSGPAQNWQGELAGQADGLASLQAEIALNVTAPIELGLQGTSQVTPPSSEWAMLGQNQAFDLNLAWQDDEQLLEFSHLDLKSDTLDLSGQGTLDIAKLDRGEDSLNASLSLHIKDPAPFLDFSDPFRFLELDLTADLAGPLAGPSITLKGQLQSLRLDTLSAASAEIDAAINDSRVPLDGSQPLPFSAVLNLQDFALDVDQVDPLLAGQSKLSLAGQFDPESADLSTRSITLTNPQSELDASGTINLDSLAGQFEGSLAVASIAPLLQDLDLPIDGQGAVDFALQSPDFANALAVDLSARLTQFRSGLDEADVLLGSTPEIKGRLDLDYSSDSFQLKGLEVAGADLTVTGELQAPLSFDRLYGDFTAQATDLSGLSESLGMDLGGMADLSVHLEGPLEALVADGSLNASQLTLSGQAVDALSGSYKLQSLDELPTGNIQLTAETEWGSAQFRSSFELPADRLNLSDLSVTLRSTTATGHLSLPFEQPLATAELAVEATDLAAWSDVLSEPISGQVTGQVQLLPEQGLQAGKFNLAGKSLSFQDIQADGLTLTGALTDLFGDPKGDAKLTAQSISAADLSLQSLSLTAKGSRSSAALSLTAEGDLAGPFDLTFQGDLKLATDSLQINLNDLSGHIFDHPYRLQSPLTASIGQDSLSINGLDFTYHDGRLQGDFQQDADQVQGEVKLSSFPLELLSLLSPSYAMTGHMDGSLALSGAIDNPTAKLHLSTETMGLTGQTGEGLPRATLLVDGTLAEQRLTLSGEFSGFTERSLLLDLELPLQLSLKDYSATLLETEPFSADIAFNSKLGPLAELFLPNEHLFSGDIHLDLEAAGTLDEPRLSGGMNISKGVYENLDTGTLLREITLTAEAEDRLLTVTELSAQAGSKGRITGGGTIEFDIDDEIPLALQVVFNNALLVNRDDVTAITEGELTLGGPLHDLLLQGQIRTSDVEIQILDELPPEVVSMDVIEINKKGETDDGEIAEDRPSASSSILRLDLGIKMPRRVFVRGRGLDSEWSGDLRVTGTAAAPRIEGQLEPVRGQFSFAGKVFRLERGTITFDGSANLNPLLNLDLVYNRAGFEAIIRIFGTADDPDFELTSRPSLPDDEILAKVLFDKSTGQLSAVEALELAAAVATITGTGPSGAGIMDKIRTKLGVDVLRVGSSDSGQGANVTVGNYLTDGVYVGIDQGTEEQSTRATVELEVTPNLTINSDVGQDNQGRVGIKWRWDY